MKVDVNYLYRLELTLDEANWLMTVMQNPLGGEHPNDEEIDQRHKRKELFEALQRALGYGGK